MYNLQEITEKPEIEALQDKSIESLEALCGIFW